MKITQAKIEGAFIIEPEPREDARGYFARIFAKEELQKAGASFSIVHINRSLTIEKGTIRGMHYQIKPMQEDKIVQCLQGKIFDVVLDIRPESKTFGQWFGQVLDPGSKKMLLTPKGCAHGFQALEQNSLVEYFASQIFSSLHERGIRYNDSKFNINWPIKNVIVSEKDGNWPDFVK